MSLYLHQNNQQTGPFSDEQVSQMVRTGIIPATTLAWKEGMKGWEPVGNLIASPGGGVPPPAPPAERSMLGLFSFGFSLFGFVGWLVLLVVAGMAHNAGTADKTFNTIVGLIFMLGICLNFIFLVLGVVAAFKTKANTLAIIGACLNGFQILGLVLLVIIGLASKGAH